VNIVNHSNEVKEKEFNDFNSDVEDSPLLYKFLARSLKKVCCDYSPNRLQSMLDNFSPIKRIDFKNHYV